MPSTFPATQLLLIDADGILIGDFGVPQIEDRSSYLLIQHKPRPDDKATQKEPYVEFCGRGMNWWGYANGFQLGRHSLVIRLDEAWPAYLPYDGIAEVPFTIDGLAFRELVDGLETIFGYVPNLAVEMV